MNLVLIGGKDPVKIANTLNEAFDDINVMGYKDTEEFRMVTASHSIDAHRMILLQNGIESIDDNDVYAFVDFILAAYPAMKILTISFDEDTVDFLSQLLGGANCAHFMFGKSMSAKTIIDFASMDLPALQKKYDNNLYKKKVESVVEYPEELEDTNNQVVDNSQIPGYIPPKKVDEKKDNRGFVARLFGAKPKQKNEKILKDDLKPIGQGQGVDEFSSQIESPFNNESIVENPNFEDDIEYTVFDDALNQTDNTGFEEEEAFFNEIENNNLNNDLFNNDTNNYQEKQADFISQEDTVNSGVEDIEEEYTPIKLGFSLEKSEEVEEENNWNIDNEVEENEKFEEVEESPNNIEVKSPDFDKVKSSAQNINFTYDDDTESSIVKQEYIEEIEDEMIEIADDVDLESMQKDYDNSNVKVVTEVKEVEVVKEVVREKIVTVGSNPFRSKNGIRTIIITGDRRVGSTKLSLNLANLCARTENVLYVDFDRMRHGCLGYLDIDDISNEPEHVRDGINHLKELRILPNLIYQYRKGGFNCLLGDYGEYVSDEQMSLVQSLLARQTFFTTVIVDCPLENLYLLDTLLHLSNVVICAEDDQIGITNLLTMLSCSCKDENMMSELYSKANFVIGRRGNVQKFSGLLRALGETLFDYRNGYDWSSINVLGTIKNTVELLGKIGE